MYVLHTYVLYFYNEVKYRIVISSTWVIELFSSYFEIVKSEGFPRFKAALIPNVINST